MFGHKSYGHLAALIPIVVGVVAFGAAQAAASSAPIVIQYHKTCDAGGHCVGTVNGVTIDMQITGFRATGDAAHLTLNETITTPEMSFKAALSGTMTPAGFIVLNGTVKEGSFAGAQIHQRSNYVSGPPDASVWDGALQLLPATA